MPAGVGGLQQAAQDGPAEQRARRDEVADHAHEGVEQRRTACEGVGDPVGERAPRDDDLNGARDPLIVAQDAPARARIGG